MNKYLIILISLVLVSCAGRRVAEGEGLPEEKLNICETSLDCLEGELCNSEGICEKTELSCLTNDDCESPKVCTENGYCRQRCGGTGIYTLFCPAGYECNDEGYCEIIMIKFDYPLYLF